MEENLIIAMSGGTTTVINATLAGIIKKAQASTKIKNIIAGFPGISGILNEELVDLTRLSANELERLAITPASGYIGTTRVKQLNQREILRIRDVFNAHKVKYFFNIGGNGTIKQSMQISQSLSASVRIAALPKTVDNDLGDASFKKVYFTPGYPSCANYWMHKVFMFNQENLGASSHDKVLIAQTFGRETGFLTAAARLADPDRKMPLILLLPEDWQPFERLLSRVNELLIKYGRAIIIMSEGYTFSALGECYDPSGQIMYSSSKTTAAQDLVNRFMEVGIQARHFIPGFDQRCDIAFTLKNDLEVSMKIGEKAVEWIINGERDFLASISIDSDTRQPSFSLLPFQTINNFSRVLPDIWIAEGNFDVTDKFIEYLGPLVYHQEVIGVPDNYNYLMMPEINKVNKRIE